MSIHFILEDENEEIGTVHKLNELILMLTVNIKRIHRTRPYRARWLVMTFVM